MHLVSWELCWVYVAAVQLIYKQKNNPDGYYYEQDESLSKKQENITKEKRKHDNVSSKEETMFQTNQRRATKGKYISYF